MHKVNFERLPTNIFATGQTLDIDHLDSLDPELYRNLLSLKTFEGDVQVCTPNTYSKIGLNILTILGQLWHRFHCCGGGVWSDQDRIAQA